MGRTLKAEDARQSLTAHAAARGAEIQSKYGPRLGWAQLECLLADRALVRYPCEIVFDADLLLAGEFAHPVARGEKPEDGFTMYVHPHFRGALEEVAWLVLYQLVLVNYGEFASYRDAEAFGAAALGISEEAYYQGLCRLVDGMPKGDGETVKQ